MDLTDETDAAVRLVIAARKALTGQGSTDLTYDALAKAATAAVLRELVELMDDEGTDEDWPDSGDLELMADDIEGAES
jgi:hypothetical protein